METASGEVAPASPSRADEPPSELAPSADDPSPDGADAAEELAEVSVDVMEHAEDSCAAEERADASCAGDGERQGADADEMDSRSCLPPDGIASEASGSRREDVPEGGSTAEQDPAQDLAASDIPAASDSGPSTASKRKATTAKAQSSSMKKPKRPVAANLSSPAAVERTKMPPPPPPFASGDGIGTSSSSSTARPAAPASEAVESTADQLEKARAELATLRDQYGKQRTLNAAYTSKLNVSQRATTAGKEAITLVLVRLAQREFSEENDRIQAATFRYGHCKVVPFGSKDKEWNGGYEEEELIRLKARFEEDRKSIKQERSTLSNTDEDDKSERREILTHRMDYLKKEELSLKERELRLDVDRKLHAKRQNRLEAARRSNFGDFQLMKGRYQLLNMIGRGGFSEVYRAYDLEMNAYCAVKIHELGKEMSEVQRQSYIRRAMREYDIQKGLKHPRCVSLQDCFPIHTKAFATVLELCTGDTLDEYMKRYGILGEREARGIIVQVLSGLRYLNQNETGNKIIHYDLKPGNLFFQCGEVKIADFGLSKIVHQSNPGESIDLTSQGAGTYWYLPPECMVIQAAGEPPKISNKVDVWSTGVIFFELLFGRRPYGHGVSQEALRRAAVAQGFDTVTIPNAPKVSLECARYLKTLLDTDKDNRPDVIEALADPYIRGVKKARTMDDDMVRRRTSGNVLDGETGAGVVERAAVPVAATPQDNEA